MNFNKKKFQYFKNDVKQSYPVGFITLNQFLNTIKQPKHETKELLSKIAKASTKGDLKLKSELKKKLFAFTPAVIVNGARKYDNITEYTGLAVLDFDKIGNVNEFKEFLFYDHKEIIAAWLSPSKKGVKALVRIPKVKTKDEFKSYSWGLSAEFEIYNGFDIAVNNAVLLMFIGYDKDILIRKDAEIWTQKGTQLNSFDNVKIKPFVPSNTITDNHTKWVVNWLQKGIDSIVNNGHPQLRSYAISLGGYVGSGYINELDALNLIENLIQSNSYLQKGVSGYIKTAKQAINIGRLKPLTFEN